MEKESITCFQYKLRNLACDGEILKLLKALHERCGGQWVYSVHQNYEVYPDTPELSEAFFYPEWWKRRVVRPAFPIWLFTSLSSHERMMDLASS